MPPNAAKMDVSQLTLEMVKGGFRWAKPRRGARDELVTNFRKRCCSSASRARRTFFFSQSSAPPGAAAACSHLPEQLHGRGRARVPPGVLGVRPEVLHVQALQFARHQLVQLPGVVEEVQPLWVDGRGQARDERGRVLGVLVEVEVREEVDVHVLVRVRHLDVRPVLHELCRAPRGVSPSHASVRNAACAHRASRSGRRRPSWP